MLPLLHLPPPASLLVFLIILSFSPLLSPYLPSAAFSIPLFDWTFLPPSLFQRSPHPPFPINNTRIQPENIQGAEYSIKSEIWPLSILLIESALGRFPFADLPSDGDGLFDSDNFSREGYEKGGNGQGTRGKEERRYITRKQSSTNTTTPLNETPCLVLLRIITVEVIVIARVRVRVRGGTGGRVKV